MSGGVVRVATKQVSASKEIFYGMVLGLAVCSNCIPGCMFCGEAVAGV